MGLGKYFGGFMGSGEGHAVTITKEAIEAQRAEAIQEHQNKIKSLQDQCKALEARVGSITGEITAAFKGREDSILSSENSIRLQKSSLDSQQIALNQEKDSLASERSAWTIQNAKEKADIQNQKVSNEAILVSISENQAALNTLQEEIDKKISIFNALQADVMTRQRRLDAAQKIVEDKTEALKTEQAAANQARADLQTEADTMALQRITFNNTKQELETLRIQANDQLAAAKAELEKIVTEKENLLQLQNTVNTDKLTNQGALSKISERNATLDVKEKVLNARESELNSRELHVKQAEQLIGGQTK